MTLAMSHARFLRLGRLATVALLLSIFSGGAHADDPATPGAVTAPTQPVAAAPGRPAAQLIDDAVRTTLSGFGSFIDHPTYGEVWVPTITPQDWRPYAACHWVNDRKIGWYYDDKTAWGAIIHHYGRWAHDANMGWIWIPGVEFSPGWVSWRTSPAYVGWAPLPPDADLKAQGAEAFNNGGFWTFMETSVFDKGCAGTTIDGAQTAILLTETQPVTDVAHVAGLGLVVLPDYVTGPLVDLNVTYKHWPKGYFASMLLKWNVVWNVWDVKTKVNFVDCTPHRPRPPPRPPNGNPPSSTAGNCGSGFVVQPDGTCALPLSPPASRPALACGAGLFPDSNGRCGSRQTFAATPDPVEPPGNGYLPPPTFQPGRRAIGAGCAPGLSRQPDGGCRPNLAGGGETLPAHPQPSRASGDRCIGLSGRDFHRCLVATETPTQGADRHVPPPPALLPRPSTVVQGGALPSEAAAAHPVALKPTRPRPSQVALGTPRPQRPTPLHFSPPRRAQGAGAPTRPKIVHAVRPSRPVFHPAFHASARQVARAPPRMSRPVSHSAPRRAAQSRRRR